MIKHLFKVSGLDTQGKPFVGSCVAWDIIDAINMFREKHYSPHEIKQGVQMPAAHPCCIVCLQGAEESFVIAQSGVDKNLRDLQLCEYLKSKYELPHFQSLKIGNEASDKASVVGVIVPAH